AIPGLFPGATYVIGIRASTSPATRAVYYSAEGLVSDGAFATAVTPESEVHITLSAKLVEPTITAVVSPTASRHGAVGPTRRATPGTWCLEDATVSYQWLRDGQTIPGANAATYVISRADRGTAITVRVTASKDGFTAGVATLSAARVPTDPAARASTKPKVSGSARLGSTLRASAGAWDLPGVVAEYQWLRGSKAIKGATSARYTLTTADVGKRVSVRVTGKVAGHADGVASSSSKKVAKGKPRVTAKASSVKVGKRAKVVVRVKASGLSRPKGTVTVRYGTRTVKVTLAAKRKGKVTVRLPQLAKGRYAIKVSFKPSGASAKYVTKASAKKTTLRVRQAMREKQMVQSVSRSPRAWLAVVGVLALLAAGLPSAAHAAGEDTIIGTVVVPAGVDVNDLVVEAYRADGESWRRATWADPEVDGSFALTGLATDLGYRVRVLSYDDGYAGGFYAGAGSQPGRGPDDGVSVRTGHAGITLSLITTVELTATYTLPPGFEWRSVWDTKDRLVSFAAEEYALDGTGWRSKSVWATVGRDGDGTVTFTGLRPDAGYRIHASDTDLSYAARFPKGYYREGVGTLIEREEFATPVRIGQTPHLNIGWTLVQPKPNLVAAPQL